MTTRRTNPLSTASRLADLDASRNKAALAALRTRLAEAEALLEEWLKETTEIQLPEMAELCAQHTRAFLEGSQEVSQ